ncbi:hypothetical protein NC652_003476 [Populus alba x Populus x berolinensis]|nr:hypothetical protein NC652_003476 [Populus alba x Populus x berolinensis]
MVQALFSLRFKTIRAKGRLFWFITGFGFDIGATRNWVWVS